MHAQAKGASSVHVPPWTTLERESSWGPLRSARGAKAERLRKKVNGKAGQSGCG